MDGTNEQKYINITEADLRSTLREGVHHLTFEKANGTLRDINATLDFQFIPEDKRPVEEATESFKKREQTKRDRGLLSAFDVDVGEWRSINTNKITSQPFEC